MLYKIIRKELRNNTHTTSIREYSRRVTLNTSYSFPIEEHTLQKASSPGHKLSKLARYKYPSVSSPPKAIIALFHGYGSYTGPFYGLAAQLSQLGILSTGFDLQGFGKSEGQRGLLQDYHNILHDVSHFIMSLREEYGSHVPIFLLGYSLGGLIALKYAIQDIANNISGIISIAPALTLPSSYTPFLLYLINHFSSPLLKYFGSLKLTKMMAYDLTNSPEILNWAAKDPHLYRERVRIATGIRIHQAQINSLEELRNFHLPHLLFHPGMDNLIRGNHAKQIVMEKIRENYKHIKVVDFPEFGHDLFYYDEVRQEMGVLINQWIEQVIQD